MNKIEYIDRKTGLRCIEEVYGESYLQFLYGNSLLSSYLLSCISKTSLFSQLYGYIQNLPSSKIKIAPFIKKYKIDASEFQNDSESFISFNDFFTRKLKPESRPIDKHPISAIIPADGRYLFYQNIDTVDGFVVKGKKFTIESLLQDENLAKTYHKGSMVLARLCPSDYHRYHFPCDGIPEPSCGIEGFLFSVNPIAIKKNIEIFCENKRRYCVFDTKIFGKITIVQVGATCVGTIHETYTPWKPYSKGDEMGYFSFGGSSLIVLFPPETIIFDNDLLQASANHTEIRCLMGQSMGQSS